MRWLAEHTVNQPMAENLEDLYARKSGIRKRSERSVSESWAESLT